MLMYLFGFFLISTIKESMSAATEFNLLYNSGSLVSLPSDEFLSLSCSENAERLLVITSIFSIVGCNGNVLS